MVVTKTKGGIPIVRSWPKPRGQSKDPDMQNLNDLYAQVQRHSTRACWSDTTAAMALTEGTIWNWREFIVKACYGTLAEIYLPGGVRLADFLTMKTEAQALLDTISMDQGTILYRGFNEWTALEPGTSGYVLTTNGPASDPSWNEPTTAPDAGFQWSLNTGQGNFNVSYPSQGQLIAFPFPAKIGACSIRWRIGAAVSVYAEIWRVVGSTLTELIAQSQTITKTVVTDEYTLFNFTSRPVLDPTKQYALLVTNKPGGVFTNEFPYFFGTNANTVILGGSLQCLGVTGGARLGANYSAIGGGSFIQGFKWSY